MVKPHSKSYIRLSVCLLSRFLTFSLLWFRFYLLAFFGYSSCQANCANSWMNVDMSRLWVQSKKRYVFTSSSCLLQCILEIRAYESIVQCYTEHNSAQYTINSPYIHGTFGFVCLICQKRNNTTIAMAHTHKNHDLQSMYAFTYSTQIYNT